MLVAGIKSLWENLFIPTPKEWHFTPTSKFTCIPSGLRVVYISQLMKASFLFHLSPSKDEKHSCHTNLDWGYSV